jgi:hypothetical protein
MVENQPRTVRGAIGFPQFLAAMAVIRPEIQFIPPEAKPRYARGIRALGDILDKHGAFRSAVRAPQFAPVILIVPHEDDVIAQCGHGA